MRRTEEEEAADWRKMLTSSSSTFTEEKKKTLSRHVVVEALQLVPLLAQRQVQVQVVSARTHLEGAVLQLSEEEEKGGQLKNVTGEPPISSHDLLPRRGRRVG